MKLALLTTSLFLLGQSIAFAGGAGAPQPETSAASKVEFSCILEKEQSETKFLAVSAEISKSHRLVKNKIYKMSFDAESYKWTEIKKIDSKLIAGSLNTENKNVEIEIAASKTNNEMNLSFSLSDYYQAAPSARKSKSFNATLNTLIPLRAATSQTLVCHRDSLASQLQ